MQLDEFLSHRGVRLEDVSTEVRTRLGLAEDDVLFVCGSLVEGRGNEKSDVDVYLITARSGFTFTSLDAVLLAVGTCLIDVKVVPYDKLHALIARFEAWDQQARRPHDAIAFSQDERALLHRLHFCQPLHGDERLEVLRRQAPLRSVARLSLAVARYYGNALQVDLAGLRRERDLHTMIFTAQELLEHAADAVLAGHGNTNPNGKWRVRQLSELPLGCEKRLPGRPLERSLRDEYVALHRAPEVDDAQAVYRHASGSVDFVRRALLFSEREILRPEAPKLPTLGSLPRRAKPALPQLDFDITVKGDTLEIYRLQGSGEVFLLSPSTTALLCLFDGLTSVTSARMSAGLLFGRAKGAEIIRDLHASVTNAGFVASPFIDETAVSRLLRRNLAATSPGKRARPTESGGG